MATLTNLLDDLRDLLSDSGDTKYTEARKIRYINAGQRAMFPDVYRILQDATEVLVTDQYEHAVPAALNEGVLLGVELETTASSSDFNQLDGRVFDLVPNASFGNTLVFKNTNELPGVAGAAIRFTAAVPLTELTTGADTYSGPAITQDLPVLYAMGLAMARDLEARLNYYRFSTTQALNGTVLEDFSTSSAYWFEQFSKQLAKVKMPMPNP